MDSSKVVIALAKVDMEDQLKLPSPKEKDSAQRGVSVEIDKSASSWVEDHLPEVPSTVDLLQDMAPMDLVV